MENSKIEWTDHTANLWWGCQKVHTGCKNCYAETLDNRYNHENPHWGPGSFRKIVLGVWKDLARFQREAAKGKTMARVFVGSMMDIFEDPIQVVDNNNQPIDLDGPGSQLYTSDLRNALFGNISRGDYPNLVFLLLTKRPENINKYIPAAWQQSPPTNVMFGTSVVDQATANKMLPELLKVNGSRFLSCEPLVGPIDLTEFIILTESNDSSKKLAEERGWGYNNWSGGFDGAGADSLYDPKSGIDWVICGGESGHNARPLHPDWIREIKHMCEVAEIPFFFKQWGEYAPHRADMDFKQVSVSYKGFGQTMCRVGKNEAGNHLDGRQYKDFPRAEVDNG